MMKLVPEQKLHTEQHSWIITWHSQFKFIDSQFQVLSVTGTQIQIHKRYKGGRCVYCAVVKYLKETCWIQFHSFTLPVTGT